MKAFFDFISDFLEEVREEEAKLEAPVVEEPKVAEEPKDQEKESMSVEEFRNFFKFYKELPHQDLAIEQLYATLTGNQKNPSSEWVVTYRTETEEVVERPDKAVVLPVPYYSQRDNYRDASRTCFSSSCAMALKAVRPKSITGDDDYIRTVFSIGDTTEAWVQVSALADYGVESIFIQDGTADRLKQHLDRGIPVPCGILHQGPASAPSGGGHWITVIGYEDDPAYNGGGYFLVNDPWGELQHSTGQYISEDGGGLKYSYALMKARWTVEGNDGWCIGIKSEKESPLPAPTPAPHPPYEVTDYLTKSDLAHIWNCAESLIKDWEIQEMNDCLRRYDITTPERIRHFMSQTAHESGGGKWTKELSDGKYLEGRTDIGNTQPGDGPKYKGAGYLQLTGRANYAMLESYVNDPRVMEGVDYVAATYPFTSAGTWWTHNRMNELIDGGAGVEEVTRRVNGGYNGLDSRYEYYERCQEVI